MFRKRHTEAKKTKQGEILREASDYPFSFGKPWAYAKKVFLTQLYISLEDLVSTGSIVVKANTSLYRLVVTASFTDTLVTFIRSLSILTVTNMPPAAAYRDLQGDRDNAPDRILYYFYSSRYKFGNSSYVLNP